MATYSPTDLEVSGIGSLHGHRDQAYPIGHEDHAHMLVDVTLATAWSESSLVQYNSSGRFRNLERGVQPLACEVYPKIYGLPRLLPVTWMHCLKQLEVRTEYLKATLGLVKHLQISKELICECVTVPGCCCCMPLLHNHLMDSCVTYAKIHY